MTTQEIIKKLKKAGSAKNIAGMARFGIVTKKAFGVCAPDIMAIAREAGKSHKLAEQLWQSGIYEARILAGMVDKPEWVKTKQMDSWARDFDNWAVCDSNCMRLFSKTDLAHKKVWQYAKSNKEFVRRTAFALIASLSVHDKKSQDKVFVGYFPLIKKYSTDDRNYVRKAVNWALRQIGKRNLTLNRAAIFCAEEIRKMENKTARWIAGDALRELKSEAVQKRLKKKYENIR